MKRLLAFGVSVFACAFVLLAITAYRFDSRIRANTKLGPITVGGLTREEAAYKVRQWWEEEKGHILSVTIDGIKVKPLRIPVSQMGITADDAASVQQLEVSDLWDSAKTAVGANGGYRTYEIKLKGSPSATPIFRQFLERNMPKAQSARVFYSQGAFRRVSEHSGLTLDDTALSQRLVEALRNNTGQLVLPVKQGTKQVPDAALAGISDVVSSFTTKFPVRKVDRNTNIRIASSKINGYVVPPGGTFSFNNVVGRRTIRDGFKEAPVFKNGKHDMGVGGGICQVSSTLYNAALFSNLKIVQRHNHSMPVPYLPVGRDATVDYGSLDLVIENNLQTPIAISSEYKPGALTFRILGKRNPAMSVKVESSSAESWDAGTKVITDSKLPPGAKRVLEKGTRGRSVRTFRVVYNAGVQVAREPLGRSYYKGGQRVIAVGPKPAAKPVLKEPLNTPVPPGAPIRTLLL
jgi:vancomycin resistance protein YoaR